MLMFIRNVSRTTTVDVAGEAGDEASLHVLHDKHVPEYVTVFRVYGPLLFGATERLARITDHVQRLPPIVILKLRHMTAIDATGLRALEDLASRLHRGGRALIVCGAQPQPASLMISADFHRHVGARNICPNTAAALARATELYEERRGVA
jgi:SulP family sulfate permease